MKKVELKQITLESDPKIVLDYKHELQTIFRTPADRSAGADYEEMRRSIRILDALDKADGFLELEDADYDYFKPRVKQARWAKNDRAIMQLVDDVTSE